MTDVAAPEGHSFGDARDDIVRRARAAKVKFEISEWNEPTPEDPCALIVHIPCGDDTRIVNLDREDGELFAGTPFEHLEVIGSGYRSIYNRESGALELLLAPIPRDVADIDRILKIPGVEIYDIRSGEPLEGGVSNKYVRMDRDRDGLTPNVRVKGTRLGSQASKYAWRLPINPPGGRFNRVPEEAADVEPHGEISPVSETFVDFAGYVTLPIGQMARLSLKLEGVPYVNYASYVERIETLVGGLFFEFDQRFNLCLSLARRTVDEKRAINVDPTSCGSHGVTLPRVSYPRAATTLYSYGRSLGQAPLNRYLAYYQSVEHFFPLFINLNAVKKARQLLSDPRFNLASDADVQRLVQSAGRGNVKGTSEREQLLATIQHAIDDDELLDFLHSAPEDVRAFLAKKEGLEGVNHLNPKAPGRITEQLRDRVYGIRNRIVHAKDSRSEDFVEPLLPFSDESRRLAPDLVLIEMVSRRVIIAGGINGSS